MLKRTKSLTRFLVDNNLMEELHLTGNFEIYRNRSWSTTKWCKEAQLLHTKRLITVKIANSVGAVNAACNGLKVVDSRDEKIKELPIIHPDLVQ